MNISKLTRTWDEESKSYKYENDSLAEYLANCQHLTANLGVLKDKKVLEAGSGSGQISAYLAAKGAVVHLVDISKKSLDFSRKYFNSKRLFVKLHNQNIFAMNFPKESFDYVWNGGVIEHFDDREKILMINKMWKLVKPGGKLVITVPNANDFPFMIAKKILELRNKWAFGKEDDLTIKRLSVLTKAAGIMKFTIYAYNPTIGFWFFPYGREISNMLNLNTLANHKARTPFGHTVIMSARKPLVYAKNNF
jgi:2-polyprenyl-3-methyl-5-hydroxy-6-metoxy-1,4-benzoquinol methylase